MGGFLNMANNAAANPALGTVANENYARELMQLFSIGTSDAESGWVGADSDSDAASALQPIIRPT